MVTWIRSFFMVSLTSCYKNTEHPKSKTPATRWSLPVNDDFTKSVLKNANLMFFSCKFCFEN